MAKLTIRPVEYEIQNAKGDAIATAVLMANNHWIFHDHKEDWFEEWEQPLKLNQLVKTYKEIKKRKKLGSVQ